MANQFHTNPWVLDTPSTTTTHHLGPARIRSIVWSGYAAQNDQLIIKDNRTLSDSTGPTTLFNTTGHDDLSPVELAQGDGLVIYDFLLHTIDSGILTVLLK